MEKLKLNLGSYTVMFKGWMNIDCLAIPYLYSEASKLGCQFIAMDVNYGLPFAPDSVDAIFTSHMIEHISYEQGLRLLKECYRVMKKGSVIRISCPDLGKLVSLYNEKNLKIMDTFNEPCKDAKSDAERFFRVVAEHHQSFYDREAMHRTLFLSGFDNIRQCNYQEGTAEIISETKDLFPEISLYVEATK